MIIFRLPEYLPERGVLPPHPRFRAVARNGLFFVVQNVAWALPTMTGSLKGLRVQRMLRRTHLSVPQPKSVGAAATRRENIQIIETGSLKIQMDAFQAACSVLKV